MTSPITPGAGNGPETKTTGLIDPKEALYKPVLVEETSIFSSIWSLIKERWRAPETTIPPKYYQGEATLPISDTRPLISELIDRIRSLWEKPAPPSIPITSKPIEVADIWQDYKPQKTSWLNSLLVNIAIIAALFLPYLIYGPPHVLRNTNVIQVDLSAPPLPPAPKRSGGGGGQRDKAPATKGSIPKFAMTQLAPPVAKILIEKPKLPVDATLLGPPNLNTKMASNMWGDPNGVPGPPSMGNGSGTGIGNGNGGGLGNGDTAGMGGGSFQIGGGVSAPVAIYSPDPPYTEQAREAKYQGDVVLEIVVQPDGSVSAVQVVKPAGLGLDQSAVKTVRTWKFKPGLRNGAPVPVRMLVDVTFRLL
jgi:protein TonB